MDSVSLKIKKEYSNLKELAISNKLFFFLN